MSHDRAPTEMSGDGHADWDRRYGDEEQLFSGHVNGVLVAEIEGMAPGSALDVGFGEGADAIWLALAGWDVTAIDISQVAIDRARQVADGVDVTIESVQTDITVEPPASRCDLVSVHCPALPRSPGDDAVGALLGAVAPGGTLLVVGHDLTAADHRHPDFDPADYVQPADVARHLDDEWTVEVHEGRPRVAPPGHEGPDIPDFVLRARRHSPTTMGVTGGGATTGTVLTATSGEPSAGRPPNGTPSNRASRWPVDGAPML